MDRYITHMEDAFMLTRVKRYNVKGRKYIGTPYKIYFEDIGLRNARLNFRQVEDDHLMENVIYNELRIKGFLVDVGMVEHRTNNKENQTIRNHYEVDFVANLGSKRYYIQSALTLPDKEKILQAIKSLPDESMLCCYESPDKFCHRHILAKWLNENNVKIYSIATTNIGVVSVARIVLINSNPSPSGNPKSKITRSGT